MALPAEDRAKVWLSIWGDPAVKQRLKAAGLTLSRDKITTALSNLEDVLTSAAVAHKATFDADLGITTTAQIYKDVLMALLRNKAERG